MTYNGEQPANRLDQATVGYPSPASGTTFRRSGSSPADAEALLVGADWAAPEPRIVEDHANGTGRRRRWR